MRWLIASTLLASVALVTAAEFNQGDGAKDELKKLEGAWMLVMSEQDGMKSDPNFAKNAKFVIKGNKMTV